MNEILEQSLLYDFYGELLTDKQKAVYESYILDDLSLAEIAEQTGVSRQGVHDMIKRSTAILKGYEDKLHLMERFLKIKRDIAKLEELIDKEDGKMSAEVRRILDDMIKEL